MGRSASGELKLLKETYLAIKLTVFPGERTATVDRSFTADVSQSTPGDGGQNVDTVQTNLGIQLPQASSFSAGLITSA